MCTIAIATLSLAGASLGLTAAGTGMQVYGQIQSGRFNKDMSRYQASLDQQRARQAEAAGRFEAEDRALQRRQVVGAGLVQAAQNGMLLNAAGEGDAMNMFRSDQAAMLALEQSIIRENASNEAWAFGANARGTLAAGSMARRSATYGAAGSLLTGAASMANTGMSYYGNQRKD